MRTYLQIPGPTNVPYRIQKAMLRPLVNHRGQEFRDLLKACLCGLQRLLRTEGDVFIFPSSGSGAIESVVVNLLNSGDRIITSSIGVFGERFAEIAERFGVQTVRIEKEWGLPVTADDVRCILEADQFQKIKMVCVPHSETTTGVASNIQAIAQVLRDLKHPALFVVDAVSAFACMPLKMDEWGIDVVITASQKGLMLPPGFSVVALNKNAWTICEQYANLPKWYWDYIRMKDKVREYALPYTPPTGLLFGLKESIKMLEEEGLENVWDRHNRNAEAVRTGIKALGLELFVHGEWYSDTVTAVKLPDGIKWEDFSSRLAINYGVVVGGGLGKLSGKIFRIGHMGILDSLDVYSIVGAIKMCLEDLGYVKSIDC